VNIQPGNLIKTTRPRIGCPEGTLGLVTEHHSVHGGNGLPMIVYVVKLHGADHTQRFLERDMEVVSASR